MLGIGPVFLLSLSLFTFFAYFIYREESRESRFLLSGVRSVLDRLIERVSNFLFSKLTYLGRHIIKLSWYYGIHKALRLILTALIKSYDLIETIFLRNRDRARAIKLEKNSFFKSGGHFSQVAEHKASVALSEAQKKKLLKKKLERG